MGRIWIPANITKTYLYTFDPLKPHFYIVKLGFTGVYIIFLISAQNIDCGYSLEPPYWGGSNEYSQSMFWAEIWKISDFFIWKFHFWVAKFSIYLNRHVFVMLHFEESHSNQNSELISYMCSLFFVSKSNLIQSTLIISKFKGLSEVLQDIRTSIDQICRIQEKINRTTTFHKWIRNMTP